jgi:hypothetical protein
VRSASPIPIEANLLLAKREQQVDLEQSGCNDIPFGGPRLGSIDGARFDQAIVATFSDKRFCANPLAVVVPNGTVLSGAGLATARCRACERDQQQDEYVVSRPAHHARRYACARRAASDPALESD